MIGRNDDDGHEIRQIQIADKLLLSAEEEEEGDGRWVLVVQP